MAERKMTIKGFVARVARGVDARSFLNDNADWIAVQPGGAQAMDVLKEMRAICIMPTPALFQVRDILSTAAIEFEIAETERKINEKIERANSKKIPRAPKENAEPEESNLYHIATIVDEKGNTISAVNSKGEMVELIKAYELPQEAMRWAARRLDENPGCSAFLTDIRHPNVMELLDRDNALAFLKGRTPRTIMSKGAVGPGSQKCKQDTCHFSHG